MVNDRDNQSILHGHGESDIDVRIKKDRFVLPGGVKARVSPQGSGSQFDEQVGVSDFFWGIGFYLFTPGDQARSVYLADQIKMRDRRPGLRKTLDHDAPDARNFTLTPSPSPSGRGEHNKHISSQYRAVGATA